MKAIDPKHDQTYPKLSDNYTISLEIFIKGYDKGCSSDRDL